MDFQLSRLANGLTVMTALMPNIESLTLGVWIKSGSRNESETEHGLAHLLEHMAFKGTTNRDAFQIASSIENVGGDINAATSIETTSYFIRLLGKDSLLGIDILADILQNSIIDEQELKKEKHVILQEISAAYDSPDDIIFDYFTQTAFAKQPIGRPILGTKETIDSFTAQNIKDFLTNQYDPDNMLVIATGCINHDHFTQAVEERLGALQQHTKKRSLAPACYTGGDYREKRDLMDTHLLLGFEGIAYHKEGFYQAQLLSIILGGTMSSRLFQEVREKRGLCYSIYSFHWGFSDAGLFGIHAAAQPDELNQLLEVIIRELLKATETLKQEELDRARAQYRAGLIMAKETPDGLAQSTARQYLLTRNIKSYKDIFLQLDAFTPKDIQIIAEKIFLDKPPTLTAIGAIDQLMAYDDLLKKLK